jgi:hypothetical protein
LRETDRKTERDRQRCRERERERERENHINMARMRIWEKLESQMHGLKKKHMESERGLTMDSKFQLDRRNKF